MSLCRPALCFTLVASLATYSNSLSQDLETIGKEGAVKINGGISLNQIFYTAKGIQSRRDPYSYFLTGNLNMSLYGVSVPLSFAISNQNRSFQQPFNQLSLGSYWGSNVCSRRWRAAGREIGGGAKWRRVWGEGYQAS